MVRAWSVGMVARDGACVKQQAVRAVMRKLTAALWRVGRGATEELRLLFDRRRLGLPEVTTEARG